MEARFSFVYCVKLTSKVQFTRILKVQTGPVVPKSNVSTTRCVENFLQDCHWCNETSLGLPFSHDCWSYFIECTPAIE